MKKLIIAGGMLLMAVTPAFGQVRNATKAGELKERIQEKRQEVRAKVAEVHANRLEKRFSFYYRRLSGLATKIENRLGIMAGNGKDVAAAQAKVDEAQVKLEEAKAAGDEAIAQFRAIDPDKYEAQRALALQARDMANEARSAFKAVWQLLKDAVALAKEVK